MQRDCPRCGDRLQAHTQTVWCSSCPYSRPVTDFERAMAADLTRIADAFRPLQRGALQYLADVGRLMREARNR
jgi:hypothetical protein